MTQAYEPPSNPNLVVRTEDSTIHESMMKVVEMLVDDNIIPNYLKDECIVSNNCLKKSILEKSEQFEKMFIEL